MKHLGYVKLYRDIEDNPIFQKPNYLSVWIYLLIKANHQDNYIILNNKKTLIKRGSFIGSCSKIADNFGLKRSQVKLILDYFESDKMLYTERTQKYTFFQLLNYEEEMEVVHCVNTERTLDKHKGVTNNNDKNDKNDKNISLSKDRVSEFDYDLILNLYNQTAEKLDLPKAQKLTATRKKHIKARIKDCGGIDGWKYALEKIADSDFLLGKNNRGWKANLDFLLQESSFTKLMEGSYDNKINPQHERKNNDKLKQYFEKLDSGREKANSDGFVFPC